MQVKAATAPFQPYRKLNFPPHHPPGPLPVAPRLPPHAPKGHRAGPRGSRPSCQQRRRFRGAPVGRRRLTWRGRGGRTEAARLPGRRPRAERRPQSPGGPAARVVGWPGGDTHPAGRAAAPAGAVSRPAGAGAAVRGLSGFQLRGRAHGWNSRCM